jgi:hypothetical protein
MRIFAPLCDPVIEIIAAAHVVGLANEYGDLPRDRIELKPRIGNPGGGNASDNASDGRLLEFCETATAAALWDRRV